MVVSPGMSLHTARPLKQIARVAAFMPLAPIGCVSIRKLSSGWRGSGVFWGQGVNWTWWNLMAKAHTKSCSQFSSPPPAFSWTYASKIPNMGLKKPIGRQKAYLENVLLISGWPFNHTPTIAYRVRSGDIWLHR